jgi:hypothetical protein
MPLVPGVVNLLLVNQNAGNISFSVVWLIDG